MIRLTTDEDGHLIERFFNEAQIIYVEDAGAGQSRVATAVNTYVVKHQVSEVLAMIADAKELAA